ncbi:CHAP domain-containing protein [Mammaliicoccus sciuri]|uniref:CHAP domain-containing protein n=2 Tax=Mammaliicoccus sciuri TaxID=1296 RepID=UPI001FB41AE5|nr:CHAP domain-containing protein [Mammaliicoccus sciuri]MCJ0922321.1 CHAP domain-containing protein [Mammaliicoccus sciuri]MCJ1761524.1 CHAP domain-containing protein [Mammaliicoccus sciuri]
MRIIEKVIIAFLSITLLTGIISVESNYNTIFAKSIKDYPNPVKKAQPNYHWKNNCTWYVFNKRNSIKRYLPSNWTHAKNWLSEAKRAGYKTGKTPIAGAILQTSKGGYGYGHVAFVEKVNANGSILISEYNYNVRLGYGTRTLTKAQAAQYNYIY